MARPERIRLGDLLIQEALLTPEQLDEALVDQKKTGRKLGRIFVDRHWVTEVQIAKAVARQLRAPFIDLSNRNLRPEVSALLPETHARRLRALPIENTPGAPLRVAMADPTDLNAYDEVARLTRREIDLAVVAESQLLAALDRVYRGSDAMAGLARELTADIANVEDEIGDLLGLSTATTEDAPVVRLLSTMFEQALRSRASDIHIEPQERHLRVRFRIDGVLHVQTEADAKIAGAVALRLKLMSGLDISEKRLPQDGRFHVKLKQSSVDVRISTLPTQHGESVVMRLLNQSAGLLQIDSLGLPADVAAAVARCLKRPNGMFVVTGPTGSGKTTTLYAALNALNDTERKIITVEDPIEYRLPGLTQVQVNDKIELTFARVLRATLRQQGDARLEVLAAMGRLEDPGSAPLLSLPMPDMPPPEACLSRSAPAQGVDLPILARLDIRLHPGQAQPGAAGEAAVPPRSVEPSPVAWEAAAVTPVGEALTPGPSAWQGTSPACGPDEEGAGPGAAASCP